MSKFPKAFRLQAVTTAARVNCNISLNERYIANSVQLSVKQPLPMPAEGCESQFCHFHILWLPHKLIYVYILPSNVQPQYIYVQFIIDVCVGYAMVMCGYNLLLTLGVGRTPHTPTNQTNQVIERNSHGENCGNVQMRMRIAEGRRWQYSRAHSTSRNVNN